LLQRGPMLWGPFTLNSLKSNTVYCPYNDLWVRTFGSLLVALPVVMMRSNDVLALFTSGPFYFDLILAWPVAWILWSILRSTSIWLDRRYDWIEQSFKRSVIQFLVGVVGISIGVVFFTYLQNKWIYDQTFEETNWLVVEFPLAVALVFLINAYYLIYFLLWKQQYVLATLENEENEEKEEYDSEIIGLKGNESVRVPVLSVSKIFKIDQLNFMKTEDGEQLMIVPSLDQIYSNLDPEKFFRANRQTIIARKNIRSFQSIENGKIQVKLVGEEDEPVIISQKRATAFRSWVK